MSSVPGQAVNKNTRKPQPIGILLIVGFAALILLAIWGASLLPPLLNYGIWIGIALLPAISRFSQPYAYLYRNSRSGTVLLNLGCANKFSGRLSAVPILSAIGWFILMIISPSRIPAILILGFGIIVLYVADAAARFIVSREPTLITEKGIYGPEGRILWSEIESHEWFMQHGDGLLVAKLKGRPWPLDEKKLRIPVLFKAEVDRIIAEKCAG